MLVYHIEETGLDVLAEAGAILGVSFWGGVDLGTEGVDFGC